MISQISGRAKVRGEAGAAAQHPLELAADDAGQDPRGHGPALAPAPAVAPPGVVAATKTSSSVGRRTLRLSSRVADQRQQQRQHRFGRVDRDDHPGRGPPRLGAGALRHLGEQARVGVAHHQLDRLAPAEVALQLVRRPLGDHLAAVDDHHPVAGLRLLEIVGGEEERRPFLARQPLEEAPDAAAIDRVEAERRLVEEEDRRPVEDAAGKVHQRGACRRRGADAGRARRSIRSKSDQRLRRPRRAARCRPARPAGRRSAGSPRP